MQEASKQTLFFVTVVLESGKERIIGVKASSQNVADRRALKRTPGAVSVKRKD